MLVLKYPVIKTLLITTDQLSNIPVKQLICKKIDWKLILSCPFVYYNISRIYGWSTRLAGKGRLRMCLLAMEETWPFAYR